MKKISIIIPVYNAEKYLKRCLESVFNQSYKNYEIIIVDDGSTDNSRKIYNNYSQRNNCRIIIQKNSGPSSARNKGIDIASGDFLFFLDSDDYLEKNCLKELIKKSKQDALVGLKHKKVYNDKIVIASGEDEYDIESFQKSILNGKQLGVVWGFLFDSKVIANKKIVFDTNTTLCEDTIFLFEYLNNVKKVYFINEYYNYYQSNDSITNNKNTKKIITNIVNSFYSINRLNEITCKRYKTQIYNAQVRLLKYELSKIYNIRDFKNVLKEKEIHRKIKELYYNKTNIKYKVYIFFLYIFKEKTFFLIQIKKKLKQILK